MSRRRIEWLLVGLCAALTLAVCVSAGGVLIRHFDGAEATAQAQPTTTAAPVATTTTPAPPPDRYHVDHIVNACDLYDLAPLIAYAGAIDTARPPTHTESRGSRPSLTCLATVRNGMVSIGVYSGDSILSTREVYRQFERRTSTRIHDDEKAGELAGFGEAAYYVSRESRNAVGNGFAEVDYELGVLDADVVVILSLDVSGRDSGHTGETSARLVQEQARAILNTLRR
ncbi:hypothetical protein [Nocardia asteroides]|uniref:hypothetical protein n=1 Tax=Nocardia asteroides TaxID=1824 RepID=UPI001E6207EA|nr:hypothetical protein [Nocardia asteroides]UGT61803.1 hypothetical protein LTT61_00130 [Nocardia asteroides]